jgi:DNA-binding response OmpR family regulator
MARFNSAPQHHVDSHSEQLSKAPRQNWPSLDPLILLIDDDASVRESICRVLVGQKISVIAAASGEEASRLIAQHEPDLIITDLLMAAVDGWDLLVRENRLRPHLPIFVITALPAKETCGADQFATEFFQKPLELESLLAAIRRHLGRPDPAQLQS